MPDSTIASAWLTNNIMINVDTVVVPTTPPHSRGSTEPAPEMRMQQHPEQAIIKYASFVRYLVNTIHKGLRLCGRRPLINYSG